MTAVTQSRYLVIRLGYLLGEMLSVKFYGVRGSFPSPGSSTSFYGGNTSCVAIYDAESKNTEAVLLDAGTGGFSASKELFDRGVRKLHVLLSHLHLDHIQGLPFMNMLDSLECEVIVYASKEYAPLEDVLAPVMSPPYFPVAPKQRSATLNYLEVSKAFELRGMGLEVVPFPITHSDPALGYRINAENASLVYLTDHQCGSDFHCVSDDLIQWGKGVDLLVHDAQYTSSEFISKSNWGHSTYEFAVDVAEKMQVKELIFFHHDPERSDVELSEIVQGWKAADRNFRISAAREGLVVDMIRPSFAKALNTTSAITQG